jgi:hypothetical protein
MDKKIDWCVIYGAECEYVEKLCGDDCSQCRDRELRSVCEIEKDYKDYNDYNN